MKKRNILLSSLAIFALAIPSVSALEAEEGWNKVESGTTVVESDKITAFEEALAEKVGELNLSSIVSNLNELYRYRIEAEETKEEELYKEVSNEKSFESEEEAQVWADENTLEEEGYSLIENIIRAFKIDKIFTKTRYEEKEDAQNAADQFNESIDASCEKVTPQEIRDTEDDTKTTTIREEKYVEFADAQKAANQLMEDNHDYTVVAIAKKTGTELENSTTEPITITEYFETIEKAKNYIQSLKDAGYQVSGNGENGEPEIVRIPSGIQVGQLTGEYNSLEEAQTAYHNFVSSIQEKYPSAQFSTNGSITAPNAEKNVEGALVEGTVEYATEAEVDAEIAKLPENIQGFKRTESKIVDQITFGTEENQVQKVFNTELEVLNYIETLKQQGYDVSKVEKELVSFEESTWETEDGVIVDPGTSDGTTFTYSHFDITLLTTFTKIDAEGNKSTVTGTVAINTVKINNNTVTMEGPSTDPNTGLKEYTSKERHNLSVTNRSLVEITGTVTFNGTTLPFTINGYLSENQNVCGGREDAKGYDLEFESITIINNRVVVDTNIINQYKLIGTATKTATVWYMDTKTTTLGYDYTNNVVATIDGYNIEGSKTMEIYRDIYQIEQTTTTKDYDYIVEGTGTKTYYDVISKYIKVTDIEWIIESMSFGKGGDVEPTVEILPPQTGVETTTSGNINLFTILCAGILILIKKFI